MGAITRHLWVVDEIHKHIPQKEISSLDATLGHLAMLNQTKKSHIPLLLDSCVYPMLRYRAWWSQQLLQELLFHRWRLNWQWSEAQAQTMWQGLQDYIDSIVPQEPIAYFTNNRSHFIRFIILTVMAEKILDGDFVHRIGLGIDILRRIQLLATSSNQSPSSQAQIQIPDSLDGQIQKEFDFIASHPHFSTWGSSFWLATYGLSKLEQATFARLVEESFGALGSVFISLVNGGRIFSRQQWLQACGEYLPWLQNQDAQMDLQRKCVACGWLIQVGTSSYTLSRDLYRLLAEGFCNLVMQVGNTSLSGVESLPDIWLEALLDKKEYQGERKAIEQTLFVRHTHHPHALFRKYKSTEFA
ncbi:MAG: hypothetical protein OXT67_08675 [Zetaproteobacteria bacterium]|nr:hypothetical protein [Zetaproteobacteria bacterium]